MLILTVKQLYDACRKLPKENGLKAETRKLGMNYSALYELNSDIVSFRIKLPKNVEMKQALRKPKNKKQDRGSLPQRSGLNIITTKLLAASSVEAMLFCRVSARN